MLSLKQWIPLVSSRFTFVRANEQHGNTKEDNDATSRRLRGGELTGSQQVTDRRALLLLFPCSSRRATCIPDSLSTPSQNALPRSSLALSLCLAPRDYFRGVCWSSIVLFPCLHAMDSLSGEYQFERHAISSLGRRRLFFSQSSSLRKKNAGIN